MSYQLGFFEVIKADYLSDAMGMVMMLGIPLVVAVAIIYPAIKNGNKKQICLAVGQALIIPLAMFAYSGYTMQGTGWRVEGDKLVLKAWPVTEMVELSSARAALLDHQRVAADHQDIWPRDTGFDDRAVQSGKR